MKNHSALISIGLLAAVTVGTAIAADEPKAIGVSQETANAVNAKAVQNGDAATLVKTGPTAADKAKQVTAAAKDKAGAAKDKAGDMTNGAKDDMKPMKGHTMSGTHTSGDATTNTTATTTATTTAKP